MNLVFINSHPIQYFVPLYQQIAGQETGRINLTVLYLSDETITGYTDKQFGTTVQWDIPMLSGYTARFVTNNSWKPSLYNGFFGLLNWGLIGELRRMPRSVVVSHGWACASNLIALWAAKAFGHTVCVRGDNPHSHERYKTGWRRAVRRVFLNVCVFSVTDAFLYVGKQNRQLYKSFGVPDSRLVFVPHAVDNARFRQQHRMLTTGRDALRRQMGFRAEKIILYVGKLIPKKRPLDLLLAYAHLRLQRSDLALVYVGEGELRPAIERYCAGQGTGHVYITGFVNQTDIARYYALADVFVMCSGVGETWGLAVNEAMNFDLPVVVSDLTGCADDLVEPGRNGYVVPTGDIDALAKAIDECLAGSVSGRASGERVARYSYDAMIAGLKQIPV